MILKSHYVEPPLKQPAMTNYNIFLKTQEVKNVARTLFEQI